MSRPLRIGWIVENDATFVGDEVRELRRHGFDVRVASVFRPQSERWTERYDGPVGYPARGARGWQRHLLPALPPGPRDAACLERALRERVPLRLVALALGWAARARREGWDHVHGSFASLPAWVAAEIATRTAIPFSFTGHAYDVQQPRPFLRRLIAEAAFVRAISDETARRLRRLQAGGAGAIRVGRLGVDPAAFLARRPSPRPELLCVARLVPKKGVDTLIDAAARWRDDGLELVVRVLGDGPERSALETLRDRHRLGARVRFEGDAAPEQVREALSRASVFALPCRDAGPGDDHDGIPVAILEAMAAGVPVVTTPIGGIPEAIVPGVHGWLVPPDAPGPLAEAVARLLGRVELGQRFADAARARVERDYRLDRSVDRLGAWLRDASAGARA